MMLIVIVFYTFRGGGHGLAVQVSKTLLYNFDMKLFLFLVNRKQSILKSSSPLGEKEMSKVVSLKCKLI